MWINMKECFRISLLYPCKAERASSKIKPCRCRASKDPFCIKDRRQAQTWISCLQMSESAFFHLMTRVTGVFARQVRCYVRLLNWHSIYLLNYPLRCIFFLMSRLAQLPLWSLKPELLRVLPRLYLQHHQTCSQRNFLEQTFLRVEKPEEQLKSLSKLLVRILLFSCSWSKVLILTTGLVVDNYINNRVKTLAEKVCRMHCRLQHPLFLHLIFILARKQNHQESCESFGF